MGNFRSRRETMDRKVEWLRRVGIWLVAAVVLLPPRLLGMAAAVGAAAYVCIWSAKHFGITGQPFRMGLG